VPALQTWWRLDLRELAPEAHTDAVEAVGADLRRRLAEGHRAYHTERHLLEMVLALDELEEHGELGHREGALARVAAWFHDAVYDPRAAPGANEADSAELAVRVLASLGLDPDDVATVNALVLATTEHHLPADAGLAAAFHDADLWILSAPEDRFDEYCEQVREEYAHVPDVDFATGRAAVLEPLLRRDHLYATRHARREWGDPARVNLGRELARLHPRAG
jgi:predicted metal-dependent HD superfamily phosphohydrolase